MEKCRQYGCGADVKADICTRCGYDQVGCFYWGADPADEWMEGAERV